MRKFWEVVGVLLAGSILLVAIIVTAVLVAVSFEKNRPAPERKPDPTVLEIGE